jgi:hypothetical protein
VGDALPPERWVTHAVLFAGVAQQANRTRVEFLRRFLFAVNRVPATGAKFAPDEWIYHRLSFMDKQLWVTRYHPSERYPDGW